VELTEAYNLLLLHSLSDNAKVQWLWFETWWRLVSQVRDVKTSHVDCSHGFFGLWMGRSDKQGTLVSACNLQTQNFTDKVDFYNVWIWISISVALNIVGTKYIAEWTAIQIRTGKFLGGLSWYYSVRQGILVHLIPNKDIYMVTRRQQNVA
jgi:hypothetical protein